MCGRSDVDRCAECGAWYELREGHDCQDVAPDPEPVDDLAAILRADRELDAYRDDRP